MWGPQGYCPLFIVVVMCQYRVVVGCAVTSVACLLGAAGPREDRGSDDKCNREERKRRSYPFLETAIEPYEGFSGLFEPSRQQPPDTFENSNSRGFPERCCQSYAAGPYCHVIPLCQSWCGTFSRPQL